MIAIERLPEPEVLAANNERWTAVFLKRYAEGARRPDSRQYGHERVREVLRACTYEKCSYCECKPSRSEEQVDHFTEVATDPKRAFDWENLYLACAGCNNAKLRDDTIAPNEILDPCGSDFDSEALAFEDEHIHPRDDSRVGSQTIRKLCLDRDELVMRRMKALQRFERTLTEILRRMIRQSRKQPSEVERELLRSYAQPSHEFSLMFRWHLKSSEILP